MSPHHRPLLPVVILLFAALAGGVNHLRAQEITRGVEPLVSGGGLDGGVFPAPAVAPGAQPPPPAAAIPPGTAAPASALASSFEAVDFDRNGLYNSTYFIPPDPIGAAGPGHVVCMVNTAIEWYTKTGTLVGGKRLGHNGTTAAGSFFESLSPVNYTFDPKVIYDQYAGRFVAITLERTADTSRILVAVSTTSNPAGSWFFTAINGKLTINAIDTWADYPGLAVNDSAIYITANMFSFAGSSFRGSRLWILQKGFGSGGFYDGGGAVVNVYDPSTAAGLPGQAPTLQPAHTFGPLPSGAKTYLVSSGWVSGPTDLLSFITVGGTSSSPTFSNTFISLGNVHNTSIPFPNAPQLGSAQLVNTNDSRVINAVCRNGEMWGAMTVVPPVGTTDAGQATAFWFKIAVPGVTLADAGSVFGEDLGTGTYTFFPSIAVDGSGNAVLGFAASGPTIYPGAYYAYRRVGDPAGTMENTGVLREGLDYYYRTFSGTRNRWGDYTSVVIDPSDDTFWVFNEFAMQRGTEFPEYPGQDGRWRTAFGNVRIPLSVSLTAFLEGPFNPGTSLMNTSLTDSGFVPTAQPYGGPPWNYPGGETVASVPSGMVDWVLVELRSDTGSASLVSTRAALLMNNGSVVDTPGTGAVQFSSPPPGSYYVVLRHRNHLAVMSASAVPLSRAGSPYDFTSGPSKYFGGSARPLGGGVHGLWGGDANSEGLVTSIDFNIFYPQFRSAASGLVSADWNLDGRVTSTDFNLFYPNFIAGRRSAVP